MALNPKTNLRLLDKWWDLLVEIHNRSIDPNEGEIYSLLKKYHRRDNLLNNFNVDLEFRKLVGQKILQQVPGATSSYELTHYSKWVISFLEHQHRVTSSAEIQSLIDELESLLSLLKESFADGKTIRAINILKDISLFIEKLRQSVIGNCLAIIGEVKKIKINAEENSIHQRYERVQYLVDRYVYPLSDLIEVGKPMDICLDRTIVDLNYYVEENILDKNMSYELNKAKSQIPKLRSDLRTAHHESIVEIMPLLKKLKDNLFAKGAVSLLNRVEELGRAALLPAIEELSLPVTKLNKGLMDDYNIEIFLQDIHDYQPNQAVVLDEIDRDITPQFIFSNTALLEKARASTPIEDTFKWVLTYSETTDVTVNLKIYNLLINHTEQSEYKEERTDYEVGNCIVNLHPLTITRMIG